MKTKILKWFTEIVLMVATILMIFSCQTDDGIGEGENNINESEKLEFNESINKLSKFNQPEELPEPEELSKSDPERDTENGALECFSTFYKASPGFDEMLALDPTSDVIFPGAILKGETIPTGEYVPIITSRAPITLSASLTNINGSPVVKITDPKLSTVREGIKEILNKEVTGATEAKVNFEITEVYSREQLNLAIGANYRSAASKVSASFDFENTKLKNKFVLKYLQVYYTIDMDLPADPIDLFSNIPEISSFGSTSPVFVSTVTYGRMILYTIESNYSKTDINAAFSASFATGDGQIDAKYTKIIQESSIKALVIGGSGGDAAQVVNGPSDVNAYIVNGGNYSKDSPGAALSYKLRYLKKGTPIAKVVLSSEYFIRQCDLAYPLYEMEIEYINCVSCADFGSPGDLYGNVQGRANVEGNPVGSTVTWNVNRSNPLKLNNGDKSNVNIKKTTELYRPNYDTDYIYFKGWVKEADGGLNGGDDNYGSKDAKIYLRDIKFVSLGQNLNFQNKVGVRIKVKRVR